MLMPRIATMRPISATGLATGLALGTGAATVVDPSLSALTLVLVALAVSAFLVGSRVRGGEGVVIGPWAAVAFSILALGGVAYYLLPGALLPFRALGLAVSATPLWWAHRGRAVSSGGRA